MNRHTITRRWEDEGESKAICSCGEQFEEPDWTQRAMAIAEHRKAAKVEVLPVWHRPSYVVRGAWCHVHCPCGWTSAAHGYRRAEAAWSAHQRQEVAR